MRSWLLNAKKIEYSRKFTSNKYSECRDPPIIKYHFSVIFIVTFLSFHLRFRRLFLSEVYHNFFNTWDDVDVYEKYANMLLDYRRCTIVSM